MKNFILALLLIFELSLVYGGESNECQTAAGSYLTGIVVQAPSFKPGRYRDGVELSHTHLSLLTDQDHKTYDVAIDNVFAFGFDAAGDAVPSPLDTIKVNDRLELCGQRYSQGLGIHWVHTNCGTRSTTDKPNGWIKIIGPNGFPSSNLESNTEYCSLWQ